MSAWREWGGGGRGFISGYDIYRKIPVISPGPIQFGKGIWVGL